jgi:sugar lactone lactonase YvrE
VLLLLQENYSIYSKNKKLNKMKKTKLLLALCFAGCMANAQVISTIAGNGTYGFSGDGGLAISAEFAAPQSVVIDAAGSLYISDISNQRIRKITPNGIISTFAGNGTAGFSGDGGQATAAKINDPLGIVLDAAGNLYIADQQNQRVRKITTTGIISTVAGNGTQSFGGDAGQATAAELNNPTDVAIDASGNLYIADESNNCVRKVTTAGIISTFAGNRSPSFSGDGGQASSAGLNTPVGLTFDGSGNLYISDFNNWRVRKVATSGIISTIAGNGTEGYSGNGGQATSAELDGVNDIALDGSNNIYITDGLNNVIRKISSSGIISNYVGTGFDAGTGLGGYTGDGGSPTSAELFSPDGIAIDGSGNMIFVDNGNDVLRKVSSKCPANAGLNVTDQNTACCGCATTGVQIGTPSVANMAYSWSPSANISGSSTIAQPTASWCSAAGASKIYTVTVSYSLCTTATSTVQVTTHQFTGSGCCKLATGIPTESQIAQGFTMYPNPASKDVTISLYDKAAYLQISDIQGRLVYETKNVDAGEFKLDLNAYNGGIYFISIKIGDTIEKQKLVVE